MNGGREPWENAKRQLLRRTLVLTGIAADARIMITAHEAHIRKFKLWVPRDCVASEKASFTQTTLNHCERTTHVVTTSSVARARPADKR